MPARPDTGPEQRQAAVVHLPLLTADECDRVLEGVQAQRAAWIRRHPGLPFYTLGAASYLDAGPGRRDAYYARAAALNPLQEREFGWLYERLLEALGHHLAAAVSFEPRAARPGFHVFLAHEGFRRPIGRIHFDLQYLGLEWADEKRMDFSCPVSFTLAVRLPRSGAGLRTWDIDKAEYDAMTPAARAAIGRQRTHVRIPYRAGWMTCHSGMLLHQIAPAAPDLRPGDMRVTLQGHALPGRDGYRLYW